MDANKIKRLPLPSNWREVHPTTYIHVDDLISDDGKYRVIPATIAKIELHEIDNPRTFKKEKKLVAFFKSGQKGLILNATMNKLLQEITGTRDPRRWGGVAVELYVEKDVRTPQGKKQDVPRIRAAKGTVKAQPEPEQIDLASLPPEEIDRLMEEAEADLAVNS